MSKELEHLVQLGSLEFGAWWLQFGTKLKSEGRIHYRNLSHLIATGQNTSLSDHIRILDGYDYTSNINGLKDLVALRGKNILLLGNHSHLGPLEGYGETILTSHYAKQTTGKDIKWVRGQGKSLKENARQLVDKSLGTIPIYDGRVGSLRSIFQAFSNNETVGIYPEGVNSIALRRGDPTAGKLILMAIERDIPVICASTLFEDNTFFAHFTPLLDQEKYRELRDMLVNGKRRKQKENEMKEKIINYAMAKIAMHLPEEKRGYYSNPQEHIDAFAYLITPN